MDMFSRIEEVNKSPRWKSKPVYNGPTYGYGLEFKNHEERLEGRHDNLSRLAALFDKHGIRWGLLFGSLLGPVRTGDINTQDHDDDLWVDLGDAPKFTLSFLFDLEEAGFLWDRTVSFICISIQRRDWSIDLMFSGRGALIPCGPCNTVEGYHNGVVTQYLPRVKRDTDIEYYINKYMDPQLSEQYNSIEACVLIDRRFTEPLGEIKLGSRTYPTFSNPERFIEQMYGPTWRVVNVGWDLEPDGKDSPYMYTIDWS